MSVAEDLIQIEKRYTEILVMMRGVDGLSGMVAAQLKAGEGLLSAKADIDRLSEKVEGNGKPGLDARTRDLETITRDLAEFVGQVRKYALWVVLGVGGFGTVSGGVGSYAVHSAQQPPSVKEIAQEVLKEMKKEKGKGE